MKRIDIGGENALEARFFTSLRFVQNDNIMFRGRLNVFVVWGIMPVL